MQSAAFTPPLGPVTVLGGQSFAVPSPGHHFPIGQGGASHCVLLMDPAGLKGLPGLTLTQLVQLICPALSLNVPTGQLSHLPDSSYCAYSP